MCFHFYDFECSLKFCYYIVTQIPSYSPILLINNYLQNYFAFCIGR